ncbi:MAG TPA: glycosyltransferase family 1 protein [Vicinamibacterales bacterium]|nr:glycosyltransferase family 1 protein [Vicinamibacterales bacterium]
MRILVDYRPALRERTGVGEYVHELAKALAAAPGTDDIALFTSSWKDRPSPALASEMPAPVRIVDVKLPVRALVWSWNRLEWPPVEWLAGGADVVHSQSPLLIPSTAAAQAVTVHDLDFLRHADHLTAEIRRDYPALARSHAGRAHAVIVSSHYAAGEVTRELQIDPARVHICPPGRPSWSAAVLEQRRQADAHACRSAGDGTRHILFLGTLSVRKNVGTLLEAYSRLRSRRDKAPPLVLAGHRTAASARWEARCEQPPLKGHVEIAGYVDLPRRIELYTNAAMLVLPSYEEGFGLPVLEAMACGVPVIVSSRGSLPEVAGDAADPIDPDDADGFAREMESVLDGDSSDRIARGVAQASRYSWDSCAAAARNAYRAAIEVHARRH